MPGQSHVLLSNTGWQSDHSSSDQTRQEKMFKEFLIVLVIIHMTMSACRPLPNGGYTCTTYCSEGKCVGRKKREIVCTSTGCISRGYCHNGECVGRKKREAAPEPSPDAQYPGYNGCKTTCDTMCLPVKGCQTVCRKICWLLITLFPVISLLSGISFLSAVSLPQLFKY